MMDYWILRQLRAKVLGDILEFIPEGYFEDVPEKLKLNPNIPNSKHFSRELGWGYLGGDLGRRLFFESVAIMTARQVSASEVLMNLGMLASTNAVRDVCREISKMALENGVSDRNAGSIAMQMEIQHIPVSESNVKHALGRYFLHLDDKEVVPYLSLLDGFVANAKKDDSKSAAENLGATDSQKSLISILPKGGRVLGVVVGLEHYQDRPTGRNLKKVEYARNDAMGIATVIRSMYPGETVDLSICVDSEASLSNLEYEIKMAIRSISDDDLFVFY